MGPRRRRRGAGGHLAGPPAAGLAARRAVPRRRRGRADRGRPGGVRRRGDSSRSPPRGAGRRAARVRRRGLSGPPEARRVRRRGRGRAPVAARPPGGRGRRCRATARCRRAPVRPPRPGRDAARRARDGVLTGRARGRRRHSARRWLGPDGHSARRWLGPDGHSARRSPGRAGPRRGPGRRSGRMARRARALHRSAPVPGRRARAGLTVLARDRRGVPAAMDARVVGRSGGRQLGPEPRDALARHRRALPGRDPRGAAGRAGPALARARDAGHLVRASPEGARRRDGRAPRHLLPGASRAGPDRGRVRPRDRSGPVAGPGRPPRAPAGRRSAHRRLQDRCGDHGRPSRREPAARRVPAGRGAWSLRRCHDERGSCPGLPRPGRGCTGDAAAAAAERGRARCGDDRGPLHRGARHERRALRRSREPDLSDLPGPPQLPRPTGGAAAMTLTPREGRTAAELARLIDPTRLPTPEQEAVIEAPAEPLRVIAGAGSGKTETMATRVLWLLDNYDLRPEEVLCLTFTRKAAGEIAERVRRHLGRLRSVDAVAVARAGSRTGPTALGLGEPTMATYNSYAAGLVKEHGLRLGVDPDAALLSDAGQWQLVSQLVESWTEDLSVDNADSTVTAAVISLAQACHEHLREPAEVQNEIRELTAHIRALPRTADGSGPGAPYAEIAPVLASLDARAELMDLVQAFRRAKRERSVLDFGDQVAIAARLAALPAVAEAERSRYRVVLLDEFQDTSYAQLQLLARLFGSGHPVTAGRAAAAARTRC